MAQGEVTSSDSRVPGLFRPEGIRFLAVCLTVGVSVRKEAWACLDCGLVWTTLAPAKLEKFLRRHCDSLAARQLVEAPPKQKSDSRG